MQHTNLVVASIHFSSPKSQSLGQATYTKNGLPGQNGYILCSRKDMRKMGRCRVLWSRSLDAHAEKLDHDIVRIFKRFRIKVHRTLPDSARNFTRAEFKPDENRDLLIRHTYPPATSTINNSPHCHNQTHRGRQQA